MKKKIFYLFLLCFRFKIIQSEIMVCIPCFIVPLLLFLWGIIKPMINWFRKPVENAEGNNAEDNQMCSLLSSCPCINKEKKLTTDPADSKEENETLMKEPIETNVDKKNI